MQTFAYLGGGIGRFYADIIYDSSRKCATMDPTDDSHLSVAVQLVLLIVKFAAAQTAGFSQYFTNISSIN